jgi:hypothetical protein
MYLERFIYAQDPSAYWAAAKYADRSWEYINRPLIHECGNWETEHYNSVLEITRSSTVSFLEILKSEIYIGLSPALYLQCRALPDPSFFLQNSFCFAAVDVDSRNEEGRI